MAGRDKKRPPIFVLSSALTSEPIMMRLQKTIASADLLTLLASPVTLLLAPGANKYHIIHFALTDYHSGATPYTLGDNTSFLLGAAAAPLTAVPLAGNIDQPTDMITVQPPFAISLVAAPQLNQNILCSLDGSVELTNGDGTVTFIIYYTTETIV